MKKFTLPLLAIVMLLTSCQKELQWNPDDSVTPGSGNPNNPVDLTSTYQPVTANSKWNYRMHQSFKLDSSMFGAIDLSDFGMSIADLLTLAGMTATAFDSTFQYSVTSLGRDSVIDSKRFTIFASDMTGNTTYVYYRRENGNYYQRGSFITNAGSANPAEPVNLQMLFLKDNQPVGTTWSEQTTIGGQLEDFKYTIKSVGGTKVVNGKTFNDVIQVEIKVTPKVADMPEIPGGIPFDFSSINTIFYAKNIGLIYEEIKPAFGINSTIELIDYAIK